MDSGVAAKTSDSPSEDVIERHDPFYFVDDPMVIFQIENRLFKVHRHYFIQESHVFRDMFSVPPEAGAKGEGMSDDRPIRLPDVTVKEFESLLKYFYTLPNSDNTGEVDQQTEENLNLLSILHRFTFDRIFKLIVRKLEPAKVPIITRIRLGEKYELDEWLFSAYETLLGRTESLKLDEAAVLGLEKVICYIQARDFMHEERDYASKVELANCHGGRYPKCPTPKGAASVAERFFLRKRGDF